jgi:hypothetical protein
LRERAQQQLNSNGAVVIEKIQLFFWLGIWHCLHPHTEEILPGGEIFLCGVGENDLID